MATEDKVPVPSEEKIGMPKRESQWPTTPAKWVELLGTPLTILIAVSGLLWGVYQFNAQQQSDSQKTVQQEMANQKLALDQERQTTLETYLNDMSDLLLNKNLHTSTRIDEVRQLARVKTLTALEILDPVRKRLIINFLFEADLIDINNPKININVADNPIIALYGANLRSIDLSGLILYRADLHDTYLNEANLDGAYLSYCNLSISNLSRANFHNATLYNANLHNSDLSGADLSGAKVTIRQLSEAKSLKGATMPDASIHP